jgi:hypothetical protein
VRRRRQQQDEPRSQRKRPRRGGPLRIAADGVRLVNHKRIPRLLRQRSKDGGLLRKVEGQDSAAAPQPGRAVGRNIANEVGEDSCVHDLGCHAEVVCELGAPLVAQPCRREQEDARRKASGDELGDRQTGRHRFAEPHLVGKEYSHTTPVRHRKRRNELMRPGRARRRGDGCERRFGPGAIKRRDDVPETVARG